MPYYRRNIYILSVTVFLASLSWQQVVPFLPKFLREIGGGGPHYKVMVSLLFMVQSLAAIVCQPLWGKIGDNVGRKPMIIRAGFCLAGVYFGMSVCRAPWQLLICRFLNGALTGFIPGSFALVGTNTPEDEAPRYVAILETTSNTGVIIGPAFGAILAQIAGYRCSLAVSGTAVLLSTLVVWLFVQEPNKVVPKQRTSLIQDFGIALRSPIQSSLLFTMMLTWMFGAAISPFLILHLDTLRGWCPWWLPAVIFSLPATAFVLSAYRWSCLGQEWGYHRNILIGLTGSAIGAFLLFFMHNVWGFAFIYFAIGFCLATLSPAIGAITCTMVPEEFRGRAYGIQQAAGTFGALMASFIAGQIATAFSYGHIFLFIGILFFSGAFVFKALVNRWKTDPSLQPESQSVQ